MASTFAQRVQLGPFFSTGVIDGAAKLEHYEAGTSTLKNIWSDRGMTTTLAQPFVADADGIFNFFADGLYKLVIKKADNTVLYTLDDWQFIDRTDPTFGEGPAISSASTIAVGPEIFAHLSGSANISAITGTIPFVWLVADGNFSLIYSANLIVPAGIDLAVRQNDVLFFLNDGAGVWRLGSHYQYDGLLISTQDSRTATVDPALTIRSTTSGTPAAGIGTGILLQAESTDEAPSDFGQMEFVSSDVGSGTEDTYFQVLLRVAGAALTACYRWVATGAFKAIFTHANAADRTYTLIDRTVFLGGNGMFDGPGSTGGGSTAAHEGIVTISANQALSGIHFYTDFTLNNTFTVTLADNSERLVIVATGTITINGTIDGIGAGLASPAGGTNGGALGLNGFSQPGGGGGGGGTFAGGAGGRSQFVTGGAGSAGGAGTTPSGSAGTQASGSLLSITDPYGISGGASGGEGGGATGGAGGAGGGSIVLVAPSVVLAATAVLNTSGAAGSIGSTGDGGGGGGGGAGNAYVFSRSYTDSGATFTQTGGPGGGSFPANGKAGGAGAAGVKQINIYA